MNRTDSISKAFEPRNAEPRIYRNWMESGYFRAECDSEKKPYCIVMPPPNITGQLHMGHALDNTIQDILIRLKRMQGFSALWLPGTDHAAIATEARIVAAMKAEGVSKDDIGREKFLVRAWEWREKYGRRIVEQLKSLGSSCDWSRERFTMDEGLSKAVTEVFVRYYEKGLIYRGERIINWCPHCLTSISDAEVEYEEQDGHFWHLKYPLTDGSGELILATTRPETMLGDTAVAVHPDDERYAHLIGKFVMLPLMNKDIPVIADEYVEKDFGTGVVKITPAHDPNDFEVGLRHDLPVVIVMTENARMNENAGKYEGLDRYEARKRIVSDLEALGLLQKVEPHKHNVGTCYRCGTVVEPRVSLQWFVKMKPLAEPAIGAVRKEETSFVPERFEKVYFNWMENIRDWCISRQLWWGHRIPAYYCADCGHVTVSRVPPLSCDQCKGEILTQDDDTLDTWFSSALWPFSTLGWPDNTEDLRYFYPTDVLVTAYDIIFFWVARMIFSGIECMDKAPFHHVLIHGLIRDAQGRKMSKSLGNGIDPLEIVEKYGADALRYALVTGNAPGNDQRFQEEKIEAGRNFANKIWNAMRFVLMNCPAEMSFEGVDTARYATEDKWILSRLNQTVAEVTANLEKYEFGIALSKIYAFIWEEYCDWYIEIAKARLFDSEHPTSGEARFVLNFVLAESMKLLHPFMPFLSEEVYGNLVLPEKSESIMIADWPKYSDLLDYPEEEKFMTVLMDAVRSVRNVRTNLGVAPSRKASAILVTPDEEIAKLFITGQPFMERLAAVSAIEVREVKTGIPPTAVAAVFSSGEFYIPLEDLIDVQKELERLNKEKDNLEQEIDRVDKKLGNEEFVGRAPAHIVDAEREKKEKFIRMFTGIKERIALLGGDKA
ncbi:MAG: valine--tRNA ligase [Clostridiaceae bacterium]|jgi:valyl-tRNA synthetase|nr:valine--tRNA ligase [Clostridiaceae bacterium]